MTDLVVRGGTVVTAGGSRVADVAVDGGRISAVEPDLGGLAADGPRGRRGRGSAGAAGRGGRPHAHAGRHRRRAGPVLRGLGRRGVRRHDHVPRLQQPGDRVVARGRAVAGDRAPRMAGGHRRRRGGRYRAQPGGHRHAGRPGRRAAAGDRGRRPDRQGVHGLRLRRGRRHAVPGARRGRRARRHARGPLREPDDPGIADRAPSRGRRGRAAVPRELAAAICRGRGDDPRDRARARRRCAAVRRPPVVRRGAGGRPSRARRGAAGVRGDVPPVPDADRGSLRRPAGGRRPVRDLAAAAGARQPRRVVGRARRWLAVADRHGPRPGPRRRREAVVARVVRPDLATAARGSRRC